LLLFAAVFFGGCFATGGYFEFGGCFAAIPLRWRILCRRGRAIRWMLRHRLVLHACSPWHLWRQCFLCRSSSSGGFCLGGLCGESSPSVLPLLPAYCISGYGRMCACLYFFFSVSFIFSPLCSCVGQVLFGRNKFVSVTAFFLMKNVLRHGREKEIRVYHNCTVK